MSTNGSGNNNPLLQLLASLSKQTKQTGDESSYFILIQETLSFSQRQMASRTSSPEETLLYQRASIQTPSQRARLDLSIDWVHHLVVKQLQQKNSCKSSCIIWVETIGARTIPQQSNNTGTIDVISTKSNPLGWNSEETTDCDIANLEKLVHSVQSKCVAAAAATQITEQASPPVMIVIESLTPLLMLHGLERTVQLLQHIIQNFTSTTLMVPVLVESLSTEQHAVLEDLADAVLLTANITSGQESGGSVTLLRRGVRERANLLRDTVPFEYTNGKLHLLPLSNPVPTRSHVTNTNATTKDMNQDHGTPLDMTTTTTESATTAIKRESRSSLRSSGKITLQHEEDDAVVVVKNTSTHQPRIYLQDDDPEFADLDEEDPDNDLDL